jgi:hypothetical protein
MGFLLLIKAEIVRSFIIMRRYWFRTIVSMVIGYGMLIVLVLAFYSNKDAVTSSFQDRFEDAATGINFVLGFIIGIFAFGIVGLFTQGLQGMARTGVLEQLCMSPHGLITNFLARASVGAVTTIISSCIMVWLVALSLQGTLYWSTVPILVLLLLTFLNLMGFGFMMGGLVLVFKQVGQVAIVLRMALFALAMFAREEMFQQDPVTAFILHALPITDAAVCLKYVLIKNQGLVDGQYMSVFQHPSFYFLMLSCVLWNMIGIFCFKYMENWSRAKGTLGAY